MIHAAVDSPCQVSPTANGPVTIISQHCNTLFERWSDNNTFTKEFRSDSHLKLKVNDVFFYIKELLQFNKACDIYLHGITNCNYICIIPRKDLDML